LHRLIADLRKTDGTYLGEQAIIKHLRDAVPRTQSRGLLRGMCPTCERLIYRAASLVSIQRVRLDITFPKAEPQAPPTCGRQRYQTSRPQMCWGKSSFRPPSDNVLLLPATLGGQQPGHRRGCVDL